MCGVSAEVAHTAAAQLLIKTHTGRPSGTNTNPGKTAV